MPKQPFILVCFLLLVPALAHGQSGKLEYGLQLGPNAATLGGENANGTVEKATNAIRFAAGGFLVVHLSSIFGIQPELLYTGKGTEYEVDGVAGDSLKFDYLELPVLVRIDIPWAAPLPWGGQLKGHILGGPWMSLLLAAKIDDPVDGTSVDFKDRIKNIDYGLHLGLGLSAQPVWWGALELSAGYDLGLQEIGNTGSRDDFKTRTFSFMLGFRCCANKATTTRNKAPVQGHDPTTKSIGHAND